MRNSIIAAIITLLILMLIVPKRTLATDPPQIMLSYPFLSYTSTDSIKISDHEDCDTVLQKSRLDDISHLWFRTASANLAFKLSGGDKRYRKTVELFNEHPEQVLIMPEEKDTYSTVDIKTISGVLDSKKYTSQDTVFYAKNLTIPAGSDSKKQKVWVNYLLGSFIYGEGYENILFPLNGEVSEFMRNSVVVRKALRSYFKTFYLDTLDEVVLRSSFKPVNVINVLFKPLSMQHFVGSAIINIKPFNDTTLYLAIFNVTGITSADYSTHFTKPSKWVESIPREEEVVPYSNISQIFQLTYSLNEAINHAGRRIRKMYEN